MSLPITFAVISIIFIVTGEVATENNEECAQLQVLMCKDNGTIPDIKNCTEASEVVHNYWSKQKLRKDGYTLVNITGLDVRNKCMISICEDDELMGYCAQKKAGVIEDTVFGILLQSANLSMQCVCNLNDSITNPEEDEEENPFDRNYVGLVYSPYDKYWVPGQNGTLRRVPWKNYTEDEIGQFLTVASKKFSYISTYGIGTASNTSAWDKGDKVAFVPKVAADINLKLGYPAIRVSVGIFRKDDVNVVWKSKELYNAIEASEIANQIFNGTVWGITVTSQYVDDTPKAEQAIEMINKVKEINQRKNLHLKVGIRIDKCDKFTARRRPEDDAYGPAYQDPIAADYIPLTSFQESLHKIANISDYILCSYIPPGEYVGYPLPEMISAIQSNFRQMKIVLKKINPNLRVIFETGVPSNGTGNALINSVQNLKQYWYKMAKFAKDEKIMFHMFEAVDQPWKNVQVGSSKRHDINGPNGADGFYGWFRRANNSDPAIYIEKVYDENENTSTTTNLLPFTIYDTTKSIDMKTEISPTGTDSPALVKLLILCFFGFILLTALSVGYLYMKLRNAKKQVISPAYVEQFHSGGEGCNTKDDNYAVALRIPYDRKYELLKENFHIDKSAVMGSGEGGIVLRGTIKGIAEPVAFKCTTPSSTVVGIKSLMSEIKILSYVGKHDNILCILGAYTKKIERGIVYVALEYCPLGSLETFLKKLDYSKLESYNNNSNSEPELNSLVHYSILGEDDDLSAIINLGYVPSLEISPKARNTSECTEQTSSSYVSSLEVESANDQVKFSHFTPKQHSNVQVDILTFYKWAYQIASAMEFVCDKNVIHADLAARNVLLASVDQVKVCDFGLSRKMYQEMGVVHDKDTPLPWRWMAPESLKHLIFSVESDVWAFGVTIWEAFSLAEVPYHGYSYDMQFAKQLEKGMRLPQPKYASPEVYEKMLECWEISPMNRPSFTNLKDFFQKLLLQLES